MPKSSKKTKNHFALKFGLSLSIVAAVGLIYIDCIEVSLLFLYLRGGVDLSYRLFRLMVLAFVLHVAHIATLNMTVAIRNIFK